MSIILPHRPVQATKWHIYDSRGFFQSRENTESATKAALQRVADETGEKAYSVRYDHQSEPSFEAEPQKTSSDSE